MILNSKDIHILHPDTLHRLQSLNISIWMPRHSINATSGSKVITPPNACLSKLPCLYLTLNPASQSHHPPCHRDTFEYNFSFLLHNQSPPRLFKSPLIHPTFTAHPPVCERHNRRYCGIQKNRPTLQLGGRCKQPCNTRKRHEIPFL